MGGNQRPMTISRDMQGHSARRMPIQVLAFLGGRKSTVVLTYAEGLQTEPAHGNLKMKAEQKNKKMCREPPAGEPKETPTNITRGKDSATATAYNSKERIWHLADGAS